jgi:F0F1-type ATP synthase membrane subunit b/b'
MAAINPDLSILLIILLVWVLYIILKKSFFDPINQILDSRDAAINGSQQQAREKLGLAEEKSRFYASSVKEARLESYKQQEAFRSAAMRQRAEIMTHGRQRADAAISTARQEISSQVDTAQKVLSNEINAIADSIVKNVVEYK